MRLSTIFLLTMSRTIIGNIVSRRLYRLVFFDNSNSFIKLVFDLKSTQITINF